MKRALAPVVAATLFLAGLAGHVQAESAYKFVRQWGTHGSGPGQLYWPSGLALDRHGRIYVTELLNDRVQRFSLDGTFVSKWGGSGSGAGQFIHPECVAIDTSGSVYVTDSGNNRVEKFRADGQFITQWGQYGLAAGDFQHTTGIAADTVGNIYVADHPDVFLLRTEADTISERVQKFTNTGTVLTQWGGIGSGPGQMNNPHGVAVDRSGHVFVCDYFNSRIQKFSNTGAFISQWGSNGTDPGQFQGPAAVAVDRLGSVYVCDYQNNRIQKFTNSGAYVTQWGSTGSGAGEFSGPDAIAVDDSGYVYVAETDNDRIQVFGQAPHVLLVHGICGSASAWSTFVQTLSDSGYIAHTIQLGDTAYSLPPRAYVAALTAKLDSIGADHVEVIAHSMGGLVTREYMRRQADSGQPNRVAQLVTLGTPYHGSDLVAKLVGYRNALDLGCALQLPGSPCDTVGQLKNFVGCLGDRRSAIALHDLTPGSVFINRLNYGASTSLYDAPGANGWDAHQSEVLVPRVYYASIGGTRSFCPTPFDVLRSPIWGKGANYHINDGAVATGSSLLTNSGTFRAQDVDVPTGSPLIHAIAKNLLCGKPYYLSDTLAQKVERILETSPASPPVTAVVTAPGIGGNAVEAAAEDSLQFTTAISDTILAGHLNSPTRTIPPTTLMLVTLVSDDARLTLQRPNGTVITPSDTSTANGIGFFGVPGEGFEGYSIAHPAAGTWTFRIDATASAARQLYGCLVSYATSTVASLATRSPAIYPGDSIRVRGDLQVVGVRQTGVSWTCRVIGPNNAASSLTLYDDGTHGDSLSADGIYGNVLAPNAGMGLYRIVASAAMSGGEAFSAGSSCELTNSTDLSAAANKIWITPNLFHAGDSVTVHATIHNAGTGAAMGVKVELRDQRIGLLLGTSTVDIASGSDVTVEAPWKPAAPDTHTIEVVVSPYAVELEADYTNNVATRTVVLGTPVGVDLSRSPIDRVAFAPPIPNPMRGLVTFAFQLPRRSTPSLEIFDVLGRRIRRWTWVDLAAGNHSLVWNGRDERGATVTPGILLCRLRVGDEARTRKLVFRP
jgi:sugar lactone lactonase YvrE